MKEMGDNSTLSDSAFWQDLYDKMHNNPKWIRINGKSFIYASLNENPPEGWSRLGYPELTGYAKLKDGSIIRSNNVWGQGEIPEEFKELMPDNAERASKEEFDNAKIVGYCLDCGLVFTDRINLKC